VVEIAVTHHSAFLATLSLRELIVTHNPSMAGDWRIGVSGVLNGMLMLFEEQESSGNVLEALQAPSESLRSRLAVAVAAEKTTELSGQSHDLAQIVRSRHYLITSMSVCKGTVLC
jgi:hypothetical protein